MSWGALGNALIGGHQAFRMAVADREEQVRREELDRRYQEEQRYRASRDTVEDQRWQAGQKRLDTQEKIAADERLYDRTTNQLDRLRESRGVVDSTLKANATTVGLGGEISSSAPLSGFAAAAENVAGGSIAPDLGADYVRQTPEQIARAEAFERQSREAARLEGYRTKLQRVDPNSPTADQQRWAIAHEFAVVEPEDPQLRGLKIRQAEAAIAASRANAAEAAARGRYYDSGGGKPTTPKIEGVGARYTRDPQLATWLAEQVSPRFIDTILAQTVEGSQTPIAPAELPALRDQIERDAVKRLLPEYQRLYGALPTDAASLLATPAEPPPDDFDDLFPDPKPTSGPKPTNVRRP